MTFINLEILIDNPRKIHAKPENSETHLNDFSNKLWSKNLECLTLPYKSFEKLKYSRNRVILIPAIGKII